jgi:hypothetical protein
MLIVLFLFVYLHGLMLTQWDETELGGHCYYNVKPYFRDF